MHAAHIPAAKGEVLHDAEKLHGVVLAVIEDLVAEHGAHGVIADVVGDPDPTPDDEK